MSWVSIIEVGLKVLAWAFNFFGAKKEKRVWLKKVSETLAEKGWVRSEFVLKLESDREKKLDQKLEEVENENSKPN